MRTRLGLTALGAWFLAMVAVISYTILVRVLLAFHESDSPLARAIGSDFKGWISIGLYALGIVLACWLPWLAVALYACVALTWLVPDQRIEKKLAE